LGYEYTIYCENHKEAFIISKAGRLFNQQIEPAIFRLDMMPITHPGEEQLYDRVKELIIAFCERHPHCQLKIASDKNAGEWPWGEDFGDIEDISETRGLNLGKPARLKNGWTLIHIYGDIEFTKLIYTTPSVIKYELERGKSDLKSVFDEKKYN
jgi:hypothetical protein